MLTLCGRYMCLPTAKCAGHTVSVQPPNLAHLFRYTLDMFYTRYILQRQEIVSFESCLDVISEVLKLPRGSEICSSRHLALNSGGLVFWAVGMDGVFKVGCINMLASKLLVVISRLGTLCVSPKKNSCIFLVHREKNHCFVASV